MSNQIDIIKLILKRQPNADSSILEQLVFLIKRHDLKWILFEGEVRFAVGHLSEAKGVSPTDFAKNYIEKGKCNISGNFELLERERLRVFKYTFNYRYEEGFGRTCKLWVTDYLGAYSYLTSNSCLEPRSVRFIEIDLEKEYQSSFGGKRQLKLDSGRVDIINDDEIIELKKDIIDCNAVGQILRYLKSSKKVKGILVAPNIHPDALDLILSINKLGFQIKYMEAIIESIQIT